MKNQSKTPGRRLTEALTKEQLESLLDSVGSKALLEKVGKKGGGHDDDMAKTVRRVLSPKGNKSKKGGGHSSTHIASDRKLIEEWNALWERWDEFVSEVGDEDGRYAFQEHHWEPPYFDGSALAADLEKVAVEMEKMIDRIFDLVDEEDLFTKALDDIAEAIRSYPEWMGEEDGDGCMLEYHTSQCVLRWLWLSGRHETKPGAVLLDKIESMASDNGLVEIDRNAIIDFIAGLPDPMRREIYEELTNGRFEEEQESVYSPWNALMLDFKRRYDKNAYLEQCGRDLEQDWRLGRPLIERAMKEEDWTGAEKWLGITFASYRRSEGKAAWFPESSLLDDGNWWSDRSETAESSKLLQLWAEVSGKMGNKERSFAARFQAAVARDPDGLESVIKEFTSLCSENDTPSLRMLFGQWADEIAQTSYRHYRDSRRSGDTWVHWMIDARTKDKAGIVEFRSRMDEWLKCLIEKSGEFKQQRALLACLTVDLADKAHRTRFAGLFSTALEHFLHQSKFDNARGAMVRNLCPVGTIDTIFKIWKKHFAHIVPDPSSSGSDYRHPVAWAKVLRSLNPDAYTRVVRLWSKKHHRRRNLWKAMSEAKLPVG